MHSISAARASSNNSTLLVHRYSRLIRRVARQLAARFGLPNTLDDSWSAGALGLLEAANRFDARRLVKFASFAEYRIRGAMLDELRRTDRLPRRLRARTLRITRARERLANELGRESTGEELAQALGIESAELGGLEQLTQAPLPLAPDLPVPCSEAPADEKFARSQLLARLKAAVSSLSQRLQTVLALHYDQELTYREIATTIGVSEPRVCQLHSEAIRKLRATLRSPDLQS